MPMPSRWSSVAGVVMLFHSPMSRMKRTLPDAVDGESDPKTASWRTHHGAMTSAKSADARDGGRERDGRPGRTAAPARLDRQARQRSQAKASPSAARTSSPSLRDSVASPASSPARANARGEPLQAAGAHPERRRRRAAGTARSCPAGPCTSATGPGSRSGSPAPIATVRSRAGVAGDRPGQRRRDGADQRERQRRRPGDVAEDRQERHLDDRRERHPVGVRRDRQDRVGRDRRRRPRGRSR